MLFLVFVFSPALSKGQSCDCKDEELFYIGIIKQDGDSIEPISLEYILKDSSDIVRIVSSTISDIGIDSNGISDIFIMGSVWNKSYYAIIDDSCYKSAKEKDLGYKELIKRWIEGFDHASAYSCHSSNNSYLQFFVAKIKGRLKKRQTNNTPYADFVHIETIKPYYNLSTIINNIENTR